MINTVNIAVCEDNPYSRQHIASLIRQCMPAEMSYDLALFCCGEDFLGEVYQNRYFDIVFMDYEMTGISGYDTAIRMRSVHGTKEALLIYISSYSHLAIKLLPALVFDFLPKPVCWEDFNRVLKRALKHLEGTALFYTFQDGPRINQIEYGKIYYFMSEGHYVKLVTVDGVISAKGKLDAFHEKIDSRMVNFRRIHKSYIINFLFLDSIGTNSVKMKNGDVLNVSRPYAEGLKAAYLQFLNYQFLA